jgi:malate dehydrogenase (oxaloacetate-decarboxylating)
MDEWDVFPREAAAVAAKAVEQGIARQPATYDEEYQRAAAIIRRSRNLTQTMMEEGFIEATN